MTADKQQNDDRTITFTGVYFEGNDPAKKGPTISEFRIFCGGALVGNLLGVMVVDTTEPITVLAYVAAIFGAIAVALFGKSEPKP